MKFSLRFLLCLLMSLTFISTVAASSRSVQAAGFVDKSFALYFDVQYNDFVKSKNLKVESASIVILSTDAKLPRMELQCKDHPSFLEMLQSSSSGARTQGMVIGLACDPQGEFIFLLRELLWKVQKDVTNDPTTCDNTGMLKTKAIALAVSFGHQAFCLEDWSSVSNPKQRFEEEFKKYTENKK